jgi:hypothetical protein
MDQGPLVMAQVEAGARLVNAFDHYAHVSVAFWLKAREQETWSLYLASDQIDDSNFKLAYGEVVQLLYCFSGFASKKSFTIGTMTGMRCISVT